VALSGVAANCDVDGGDSRTVSVPSGGTADLSFAVSCTSVGNAVITGVSFDWSSHRRLAPGSDNWPATWSDDNHQYAPWGDGGGFGGTNSDGRVSLGVGRIEGGYDNYVGVNRYGGKNPECPGGISGKSHGAPISIGGQLYMWKTPSSGSSGYARFTLYRSGDKGCTWTETSVEFARSTYNLAFASFINFGKDNASARDGYVYTVAVEVRDASELLTIQAPGEIVLLRAPADQISTQAAYEFFAGLDGSGSATWSTNAAARAPVFEDPNGVGPFNQAIYVPELGRYVLTTEHTASGRSNLTLAEGPEPWGPWNIVLYTDGWGSAQVQRSMFQWNFAPKWFRNGGKDFTLIFSGTGDNDSWNTINGSFNTSN
jgi:hypothetical protein